MLMKVAALVTASGGLTVLGAAALGFLSDWRKGETSYSSGEWALAVILILFGASSLVTGIKAF